MNCSSDKGLTSQIDEELKNQLNNNPFLKWANNPSTHFSKEEMQMTSKYMKKNGWTTKHQGNVNQIPLRYFTTVEVLLSKRVAADTSG